MNTMKTKNETRSGIIATITSEEISSVMVRLLSEAMGDAIENIPAKHFKEQEVWIKTKAPDFVVTTNNEIPNGKAE